MRSGDFYSSEKCMTMDHACDVRMDLLTKYGEEIMLKEKVSLIEGEIIDSMFMSKKALCQFIEDQLHVSRLPIGREAHHFVLARIHPEADVVRERRVEQSE